MCGIAGFAGIDTAGRLPRDRLERMCDAIYHRGPDSAGYFVEPGIAMGMRRLSIIDISGGQQPICNEDGTVTVVFNGEIYNPPCPPYSPGACRPPIRNSQRHRGPRASL